jgi:hypothetical protein
MSHYKCVGCRIRLHRPGPPAELVGDLCPGCGSLLEPVGELAGIVGFQAITECADSADGAAAVSRWVDDAGSFHHFPNGATR